MRTFGSLVVIATLGTGVPALAAGDFTTLYSTSELVKDQLRYERRINELFEKGIKPFLTEQDRQTLGRVQFELPLPKKTDPPMNFFAGYRGGRPFVALPVLSLKMVEDLTVAYAWLSTNHYSMDTIDLYAAMLRYKSAGEFPGGAYP